MNKNEAVRQFNTFTKNDYTILDLYESSEAYYFIVVDRNIKKRTMFDYEIWRLKRGGYCAVPYPHIAILPDDFWSAEKREITE